MAAENETVGQQMESMEPLVSIVVPIYNGEKYLDQCISSVLSQTYKNIEVILVNDGSIDDSLAICRYYADLDSRIKVISQENFGLVTARKNGIQAANGKYVGFVDADDYLEPDTYQRLMACKEDFDLVICRWFREDKNSIRCAYDKIAMGSYKSQEDMKFLFRHLVNVSTRKGDNTIKSGISTYVWNKLYKTAMAKTVLQEVDANIAVVEDIEFTYRYILKCNSVLFTNICGYHYRVHDKSISHEVDKSCKYLKNLCKLYESLLPVFESSPCSDILLPQFQFKIATMIAKAPKRMGFLPEAQNRTVIFPFLNTVDNMHIALYGADELGQNYYRQIKQLKLCEIDLWVDENWSEHQREGYDVLPVNCLLDGTYEYIVIAAYKSEEAAIIKEKLCSLCIEGEKILWKEPFMLSE